MRQSNSSSSMKSKSLSRRGFLEKSCTGIALAGAAVMPAWARDRDLGFLHFAQGQAKVSKASARYQDRPNKGQQCAGCTHFRGPSDCEIVQGPISPNGWCRHFSAKGGSSGPSGGRMQAPSGGRGY